MKEHIVLKMHLHVLKHQVLFEFSFERETIVKQNPKPNNLI